MVAVDILSFLRASFADLIDDLLSQLLITFASCTCRGITWRFLILLVIWLVSHLMAVTSLFVLCCLELGLASAFNRLALVKVDLIGWDGGYT